MTADDEEFFLLRRAVTEQHELEEIAAVARADVYKTLVEYGGDHPKTLAAVRRMKEAGAAADRAAEIVMGMLDARLTHIVDDVVAEAKAEPVIDRPDLSEALAMASLTAEEFSRLHGLAYWAMKSAEDDDEFQAAYEVAQDVDDRLTAALDHLRTLIMAKAEALEEGS